MRSVMEPPPAWADERLKHFRDYDYEVVSCDLCGNDQWNKIHEEDGFTFVRCSACGHVYTNPRFTQESLIEFYRSGSMSRARSSESDNSDLVAMEWHRWVARTRNVRLLEVIAHTPPGGRVLEIGCGSGDILSLLKYHRYDCYGVELDERAALLAEEFLGSHRIFRSSVEDLALEPSSLDCVAMFSVIEHYLSPTAVVAKLTNWLKPTGCMIIHTFNLDWLLRHRHQRSWHAAEGHLHFFSLKSLESLLQKAGMTIVDMNYVDDPLLFSYHGMYRILRARLANLAYKGILSMSRGKMNLQLTLSCCAAKSTQAGREI